MDSKNKGCINFMQFHLYDSQQYLQEIKDDLDYITCNPLQLKDVFNLLDILKDRVIET
jgi:hypothetical protein